MRLQDTLWLSFRDLSEKKVRTALTIVMVMIGVASIIALVSQTAGISQSISTELEALGPTSIIMISSNPLGFTASDTATLSSIPDTSAVIPILTGSVNLLTSDQNTSATLIGITPQGLQSLLGGNVSLYQGSIYAESIAPASLIGHSLAFPSTLAGKQDIFVGQPATLQVVSPSGGTYAVPAVGIMNEYGSSIIPVDTGVIMSLTSAETLLHRSSFNIVLVKATNVSDVATVSQLITNIYGSNARIITTQQIEQTVASIIGSISILLVIIAGISLIVAAIGIMNIMLIAVYERTHEIGIMKSIGFKNRDILTIFVFQALLIGIFGGIAGIAVGAVASYGLSAAISAASSGGSGTTSASSAGFRGGGGGTLAFGGGPSSAGASGSLVYQPVFSPESIALAIFVAVLVSVLAGVYPAWRASKLEPIDALRQL